LEFGRGADKPLTVKADIVTKHKHVPRTWTDTSIRPKQWKRKIRFGSWNVMSLYKSGSPTTAARELARYKLDLVGVQEVSWDKWGSVRARDYIFVYGK
jgi:hypothetical protein